MEAKLGPPVRIPGVRADQSVYPNDTKVTQQNLVCNFINPFDLQSPGNGYFIVPVVLHNLSSTTYFLAFSQAVSHCFLGFYPPEGEQLPAPFCLTPSLFYG